MILLLLSIPLIFSPLSAAPVTSVMLSETKIIETFSLWDLEMAIQGLSETASGGDAWCSTPVEHAKLMLLPLRPIYEKKLNGEKKRARFDRMKPELETCEKKCMCGVYAGMLSEDSTPSDLIESLNEKAKNKTHLSVCLKEAAKKLCKSPLLPSLRKIGLTQYRSSD